MSPSCSLGEVGTYFVSFSPLQREMFNPWWMR